MVFILAAISQLFVFDSCVCSQGIRALKIRIKFHVNSRRKKMRDLPKNISFWWNCISFQAFDTIFWLFIWEFRSFLGNWRIFSASIWANFVIFRCVGCYSQLCWFLDRNNVNQVKCVRNFGNFICQYVCLFWMDG